MPASGMEAGMDVAASASAGKRRKHGIARPQHLIERNGARSARNDRQQNGDPKDVVGPAARIDEELDHHGHEQEAGRGKAGSEPDDQQHWKDVLGGCRHVGGDVGRQKRNLIFLAEEVERFLANVEALDFGLAGSPEDAGNRETRHKRHQAIWHKFGKRTAAFRGEAPLLNEIDKVIGALLSMRADFSLGETGKFDRKDGSRRKYRLPMEAIATLYWTRGLARRTSCGRSQSRVSAR